MRPVALPARARDELSEPPAAARRRSFLRAPPPARPRLPALGAAQPRASSALAVALLGLSAPAGAELAPFAQRTGAADPLENNNVGFDAKPTLGNLDVDGDLDLVAGEGDGNLSYFENSGNALSPGFVQRTGSLDPFALYDLGFNSSPSLGDFDGDGKLDLIAGDALGVLSFLRNTFRVTIPSFEQVTGAANPLDGEDVGFDSAPTAATTRPA